MLMADLLGRHAATEPDAVAHLAKDHPPIALGRGDLHMRSDVIVGRRKKDQLTTRRFP